MTKEQIKTELLEKVAEKKKDTPWYSQEAHKLAVGIYWLNLLGVKDQKKRDEALAKWGETPGGFGSNASGLAQQLGRPRGKDKLKAQYAGF